MDERFHNLRRIMQFAGEALAETLWPTRCALCDVPGQVLCDACARELPLLDWWRACPRCGAAFGRMQCDLCNPVSLGRIGRDELPFRGCASATMFTEATGELVRVYKDQGEQRLARVLARYMACAIVPTWSFDAVTFVPATRAALSRRGFDHAELVAREVAEQLETRCIATLDRPRAHDQRTLGGRERIVNVRGRFSAQTSLARDMRLLLVDDVFTTGSTLCAATDALLAAGARHAYCLTFARV